MNHNTEKIRELFTASLPLFSALGDPIRQQLILLMIDPPEKSVEELASYTNLSRPTVSHHLRVLKDAHIVGERKIGRKRYYYPKMGRYFPPMKELIETITILEKQ